MPGVTLRCPSNMRLSQSRLPPSRFPFALPVPRSSSVVRQAVQAPSTEAIPTLYDLENIDWKEVMKGIRVEDDTRREHSMQLFSDNLPLVSTLAQRILESSALAQCPTLDFTKLGSVNNTEGRLRLVLKGTEIIPIAISALAMANKHLVEAGADFQLHFSLGASKERGSESLRKRLDSDYSSLMFVAKAVAASLPPFNEEKACKVGKGTSYHSAAGWVLSCFRSSSKPPSARYASISAVGNVALQVAAQILIWANTSLFLGREPDTRPDPGMRPQPRISTVVVPTLMTSSAAQGDTNVEVVRLQLVECGLEERKPAAQSSPTERSSSSGRSMTSVGGSRSRELWRPRDGVEASSQQGVGARVAPRVVPRASAAVAEAQSPVGGEETITLTKREWREMQDQMQSMLAQQQQLMSLVQAFTAGVSFGSSSHAPAHSPVQQAPPASPRQATRARYQ
ncbi:hypothetical protein V8C86DRAFT_2872415 [Haematococcus lacustris]